MKTLSYCIKHKLLKTAGIIDCTVYCDRYYPSNFPEIVIMFWHPEKGKDWKKCSETYLEIVRLLPMLALVGRHGTWRRMIGGGFQVKIHAQAFCTFRFYEKQTIVVQRTGGSPGDEFDYDDFLKIEQSMYKNIFEDLSKENDIRKVEKKIECIFINVIAYIANNPP